MNTTQSRPQLPALTSLRYLAAVWVAIFHAQAMRAFFGPEWLQPIGMVGYLGVSFFFVLSGFILVYTYAGRVVSLREFWQLRFARIYPAFVSDRLDVWAIDWPKITEGSSLFECRAARSLSSDLGVAQKAA